MRSPFARRLFWFIAGGGLSYLLIAEPFQYLSVHSGPASRGLAICSVTVSLVLMFSWNVLVNFPTKARRGTALGRYLFATTTMVALSGLAVGELETLSWHRIFVWYAIRLDRSIVVTQFLLAGLKFYAYHKWVFPAGTSRSSSTANASH